MIHDSERDETTSGDDGWTNETAGAPAAKAPVRVLVCRVGAAPVAEALVPDERGNYLAAMQSIVGGLVTVIGLEDGLDLWCNDQGAKLPLNRVIPARAPAIPAGFEDAAIIMLADDLARPGEMGEWRIRGDFFLARATDDGDAADVSDEDIARYQARWRGVGAG